MTDAPSHSLPREDRAPPTILANVRVVLPHRVLPVGHLLLKDGCVAGACRDLPEEPGATVVDGGGGLAMPGYIDIHCHGDGVGSFFDDVNRVAMTLLRKGTTTALATLGYCDMQPGGLARQVEQCWASRGDLARQTVPAIHLEGPYINSKYGALCRPGSENCPDPAEYGPILDRWSEVVRLWTLAPELRGAEAFIDAAAAKGIILEAGHTEVGADQLRPLVPRGVRVATHWANASGAPPPRLRGTRSPGVEELALISNDMVAEVICDAQGLHVPPTMLKLLYRAKGPDRVVLISDCYWSVGGDDGAPAGTDVFFTPDGELCGSKLSMAEAVRNFRKHVGCGLPELSRMAALNAARLLGWSDRLGSLERGKVANVLLLNDALELRQVWLAGEAVLPAAVPVGAG